MRKLWCKCVCILILQFVLVVAGLANTLGLSEQGEVFAETDRYRVRFRDSVVNVLDLVRVARHIGTEKRSNPRVDVTGDGVVNILDLTLVAQYIG